MKEENKLRIVMLFYEITIIIILPIIIGRLIYKNIKQNIKINKNKIIERFSFTKYKKNKNNIWIHAVSLGEAKLASKITKIIKIKFPQSKVLITTTTFSGYKKIKNTFKKNIKHNFLPYDINFIIKNFIIKISPKLCIFIETGIWPNIIQNCYKKKIPIIFINFKISKKSQKKYMIIKNIIKKIINKITLLSTQNLEYKRSLIYLKTNKKLIRITGNIKLNEFKTEFKIKYKNKIKNKIIILAISTHKIEDEKIIILFKKLNKINKKIILIIAPRYMEEIKNLKRKIKENKIKFSLLSKIKIFNLKKKIIIIDKINKLKEFYKIANIAFVGGSLIKKGGHNIIEPIINHIPTITGNNIENFKNLVNEMIFHKSIIKISNIKELKEEIIYLSKNKIYKKNLIKNGKKFIENNRKSMKKNISIIEFFLKNLNY